jgi:DNA-binding transcriptional ArsR family regulator
VPAGDAGARRPLEAYARGRQTGTTPPELRGPHLGATPGEPHEAVSRVDAVLAALADPTRRAVLEELSTRGPLTATQLAHDATVTRQAVVKHLATLAHAGLVVPERRGREVRYQLRPDALSDVTAWLAEVGAAWDQRLAALRRQLGFDEGT